jgi:hypothetical protein
VLKQAALIRHKFDEDDYATVAASFGSIEEHKRYRDAVIHARVLSPTATIAPSFERKGETFEVLISMHALDTLCARLDALCLECAEISMLFFSSARFLGNLSRQQTEDEKREAWLEFRAGIVLLRDHQRRRKSLPSLPKFPDECLTPQQLAELQELQD